VLAFLFLAAHHAIATRDGVDCASRTRNRGAGVEAVRILHARRTGVATTAAGPERSQIMAMAAVKATVDAVQFRRGRVVRAGGPAPTAVVHRVEGVASRQAAGLRVRQLRRRAPDVRSRAHTPS